MIFVVGDRIVTQSDVLFETFFDAHDHGPIPPLEDPLVPAAERLRDIAVVRQLAGEISVFRPSNADVRARADAFLSSWPRPDDGLASLEAWGLDEQGFLGFVYSRLVIERCILRTIGPVPAAVDAAATSLWTARYQAWIEQIRERADVRVPPPESAE